MKGVDNAGKATAISQIDLISAVFNELDRQGIDSLVPRQANTVIRCVNEMIREIEIGPVEAKPNTGLEEWLSSDEVGLSSRYMASVLSGAFIADRYYPMDIYDFGRCVKMLDAVPELKEHLPKMSEQGGVWARLVRYWPEAEKQYRAGNLKACDELIRAATGR